MLCRHVPTRLGVAMRYVGLKALARTCGEVVAVFDGAYLFHLECADFGDHVSIHPMCYIDAAGGLTIGSHVSIAHGVTIMTTEHDYTREIGTIRDAPAIFRQVRIEDNVWIGAGAKVLAGVRIGGHSVVGAGAVVTSDVEPGTVVVGVPARVLRRIEGSG